MNSLSKIGITFEGQFYEPRYWRQSVSRSFKMEIIAAK